MDYYLNPENSSNRLIEEYQKHGTLVVAFDFDDTVYDFHQKGRIYSDVIILLQKLKAINCYLICWTGQEDLVFVSDYLKENGIPFDAINENPPFHKLTSRKIYANAYLDDRAGLRQVYGELKQLMNYLKTGKLINKTELISEIIHRNWTTWAKEIITSEPNISKERVERWQNDCFIEYENLSDEMKDLDRTFAKEILEKI
jgi:hydroxymethylpyrimidine pyrophosphatase-like HAD family hydrolase